MLNHVQSAENQMWLTISTCWSPLTYRVTDDTCSCRLFSWENKEHTGLFKNFYIFAGFLKRLVIEPQTSVLFIKSVICLHSFIFKCMNFKEKKM